MLVVCFRVSHRVRPLKAHGLLSALVSFGFPWTLRLSALPTSHVSLKTLRISSLAVQRHLGVSPLNVPHTTQPKSLSTPSYDASLRLSGPPAFLKHQSPFFLSSFWKRAFGPFTSKPGSDVPGFGYPSYALAPMPSVARLATNAPGLSPSKLYSS